MSDANEEQGEEAPRLPDRGETDDLAFDLRDVEIFKIPDPKTKLGALQNYFFPRLDLLIAGTLRYCREAYDLDPLDDMTLVHRPNHRQDAKRVVDYGEVYVGLSPKRAKVPLQTLNPSGKPYVFGPGHLVISMDPVGGMQASLRPFTWADHAFRERVSARVESLWDLIGPVMETMRITSEMRWSPLRTSLRSCHAWSGAFWHLPLADDYWLLRVMLEFVALYPMLDAVSRMARGLEDRLQVLYERFMAWQDARLDRMDDADDEDDHEVDDDQSPATSALLDSLESYRMVRAGLWWQILARDNWTCLACGRTPSQGVTLHVDHVLPRSKGGGDDPANLQTLCQKCNIGKSNRSETNLRR